MAIRSGNPASVTFTDSAIENGMSASAGVRIASCMYDPLPAISDINAAPPLAQQA
jgi:hypothetical protein